MDRYREATPRPRVGGERGVVGAGDGAVRMGVEHGLFCLRCCWLLFAILFPLGVMNIAAMAAITLLIFAEKSLPVGVRIGRVAAAALIGYGLLVMAAPRLLLSMM